jgi:hypothetical protein
VTTNKNSASGYAGLDSGSKISASQIPAPAPATLGGVKSKAAVTHQFLTGIGTDGSVSQAQPTTDDVSEGANLYYTTARFDSRFALKTTGDLTEGTNLYWTQARFDTAFSAKSTTNLSEGSNLYHTDARARAAISANSPLSYNSATGVFSTSAASSVANDTNVTGSIASNVLTLGWTGTLAKSRQNAQTAYLDAANAFTSMGINSFAGSVGVGTSSPVLTFHIKSTLQGDPVASGTAQSNGTMRVQGGNDSVLDFGVRSSGGIQWIQAGDRTALGFHYPLVLNPLGGNVGVGTLTPGRELEVNGGVMLNTTTGKPSCSSSTRGTFWVTQGAGGVKDSVEVCAKAADDSYAWRTLY